MPVREMDAQGLRLCYRVEGTAGPALVLIHGMFGDSRDWAPVIDPLSRRFRVVALDLPGFGGSSKQVAEEDGALFVAAVRAVLDAEDISTAILCGNSFGGQVAMLFAASHPERTAGLVLANSGGFQQFTAQQQQFAAERMSESVIRGFSADLMGRMFATVFRKSTPETQAYVEKQRASRTELDWDAYSHSTAAAIRCSMSLCLLDRLEKISAPVQLIWGAHDPILPLSLAEQAQRQFPNAQLHVLADCGHVPQLECPLEFVELVTGAFGTR